VSADAQSWERMLASMRVWFRNCGAATEGFRCIERDGVLATVTPAVPDRSLPNSVVYESEEAIAAALDELAATYDEAGVRAWTVWTPAHDERTRDLLAAAGHVLDASPAAMVLDLADAEPPRPDDPEPDPNPQAADMGRINDAAYGLEDAFTVLAGEGPLDPAHAYVARVDGGAAAFVGTRDHGGDCSVWEVAALPAARGRGPVSGLMRRALADGRERGCEISTLQATKLGQPVYERLGYRQFGTIEMWERRKVAA
jgi:ribosomal protein S18 acetylase RimI-like enzyme